MTPADIIRLHEILDTVDIPGVTIEERLDALIADYRRLLKAFDAEREETPRERLLQKLDEDRCDVLMLLADACLDEKRDREAAAWEQPGKS